MSKITTAEKAVAMISDAQTVASQGVIGWIAPERGQQATIVTERAVFQILPEGLMWTGVARGIDVRRDIIEQMEFPPVRIATDLAMMDEALFAA